MNLYYFQLTPPEFGKDPNKTGDLLEDATKATVKGVGKIVGKGVGKDVEKTVVKSVIKSAGKKVPIAGAVLGAQFANERAKDGEYGAAVAEFVSFFYKSLSTSTKRLLTENVPANYKAYTKFEVS